MKQYRLKPGQDGFQPVSGPMARRRYERGAVYAEDQVPPGEMGRFEEVVDVVDQVDTVDEVEPKRPARAGKKEMKNA